VIDGGTYDGTGFHSSGLVLSFPPQLFAYRVKFTKPGTYTYFCVVHPDMKASVNVT
jgi:plastocyanin